MKINRNKPTFRKSSSISAACHNLAFAISAASILSACSSGRVSLALPRPPALSLALALPRAMACRCSCSREVVALQQPEVTWARCRCRGCGHTGCHVRVPPWARSGLCWCCAASRLKDAKDARQKKLDDEDARRDEEDTDPDSETTRRIKKRKRVPWRVKKENKEAEDDGRAVKRERMR
jgi:hypothetical protein